MDSQPLEWLTTLVAVIGTPVCAAIAVYFAAAGTWLAADDGERTSVVPTGKEHGQHAVTTADLMVNRRLVAAVCLAGTAVFSAGFGWMMALVLFRTESRDSGEGWEVLSWPLMATAASAIAAAAMFWFCRKYALRKDSKGTAPVELPLYWMFRLVAPLRKRKDRSAAPHGEADDPGLTLGEPELALMENLVGFASTSAREIMIPRTEIVCLYANLPFEENRSIAMLGRHTRYPVCAPDKDHIVGYVHVKDLLKDGGSRDMAGLIRPIMRVPESMPISHLLRQMQGAGAQIALLVDEYGGTAGIVTAEDILEEIVGEIRDEFDSASPAIVERDERTFSVDGLLHIEDFNEFFGTQIFSGELETIGGWVYARLELPPRCGESVSCGEYRLIVEEVDHLRISRLLVCRNESGADGWQGAS